MQYVKQIEDEVPSMQFDLFSPRYLMVTVHDTDTNTDAEMAADEILYEFIVGVGFVDSFGVVVRHSQKTASLHNHIVFAETTIGSGMGKYPGSDYCVILNNGLYSFSNGTDGHELLSINISDNSPEVAGLLGSVVKCVSKFAPSYRLCTLYDYLGYLCRSSGLNIFSYQKLHLFSELRSVSTIIKFSESDEAKRFFMKMYLDVTRSDHK